MKDMERLRELGRAHIDADQRLKAIRARNVLGLTLDELIELDIQHRQAELAAEEALISYTEAIKEAAAPDLPQVSFESNIRGLENYD